MARVIGGVIGFLLVLEFGLRAVGPLSAGVQEQRNRLSLRDHEAVRILCIGESITAFGGKTAYPKLLERELNSRDGGDRYVVVNGGRPGTDSTGIIDRIGRQLERYDPDIVVSMMGINDARIRLGDHAPTFGSRGGFLHTSYAYHRLNIALAELLTSSAEENEEDKTAMPTAAPSDLPTTTAGLEDVLFETPNIVSLTHLLEAYDRENAGEAADRVVALVHARTDEKSSGSSQVVADIGAALYAADHHVLAIELLERGRDQESPPNENWGTLARLYGHRVAQLTKHAELEGARKLALRALAYAPAEDVATRSILYSQIALIYSLEGAPREAGEHATRSRELRASNVNVATQKNYRLLYETLSQNDILLIAAEYPGRDVGSLSRLLVGLPGVVIADNENPFREATAGGGYYDYFTDNFAGDVGHLNERGRQIIARNVADAILGAT